ncbi:unnamed protein product [Oikopleura dioica]|uniref:Iodothyronine deiodinase n=1 Tax=Oikopleura dioica TaxID=34765 RepID=E4Y266_OIKDI|nr:unnamed protein product [Oikopleura dioica]
MKSILEFEKIVEKFSSVTFLTIYVREAHPTDGWAINNSYNLPQAISNSDRIKSAQILKAQAANIGTILADAIGDEIEQFFSALPERLAIIKNGKVEYLGGPGPFGYDLDEMVEKLEAILKEN